MCPWGNGPDTSNVTPFCFEHEFVAPSPAAVCAAYFESQADQDLALEITRREVLELDDTGDKLVRVCRVVPKRQLPALLKPFASTPLHYIERVVWHRDANEIEIEMRPSLFRATIRARYRVERVSSDARSLRRRYTGDVSVDVALLAGRIERTIVAEFERSIPLAAVCTQNWLDRQAMPSVTARA